MTKPHGGLTILDPTWGKGSISSGRLRNTTRAPDSLPGHRHRPPLRRAGPGACSALNVARHPNANRRALGHAGSRFRWFPSGSELAQQLHLAVELGGHVLDQHQVDLLLTSGVAGDGLTEAGIDLVRAQ